ncbi:hypothetical protein [Pedobacter sp. ASV28]|uniref:hypothetical protein n=1 Tax=Pedobacter sp. ASV28 TaxID=2795123 RepID=UPI0018ED761B|nr:hypothetical protein [Pedobacter sp. ASV28]
MKTLFLAYQWYRAYDYRLGMYFALLLVLWWLLPKWLTDFPELAFADLGIWHLIWLGVLLWMLTRWLSGHVFGQLLERLKLPALEVLILEFNVLTTWQKYILYYALFALCWLSLLWSLLAVL